MLSKAKLALALGTLIILNEWAVPIAGAAHTFLLPTSRRSIGFQTSALLPIRFREDREAGLLVNGWINGTGPYTFALDTGTDVSMIVSRVAKTANLRLARSRHPIVGGLSRSPIASSEEAVANEVAIGTKMNVVPTRPALAVVQSLPGGIDGILNPSDLFGSLAYSIDLPNRQLLAFDTKTNGLDLNRVPKDGAVVRWVRESGSNRPLVRLGDGRLALLDTGSGFGLAVSEATMTKGRNHSGKTRSDLGGGAVQSRNVGPTTVNIGTLVLRGVPTDLLIGVSSGTPLILGRRALYPFKLTFDPSARLIAIEPAMRNENR